MQKKNEKEGKDRLILALVILYICVPAFVGLLTYSIKSLTELGKKQETQNSRTYRQSCDCNATERCINTDEILPKLPGALINGRNFAACLKRYCKQSGGNGYKWKRLCQ